MEALPVKKFHGVGPATAEKMHRLGINTGADLKSKSLDFLLQNFGRSGPYFYGLSRGIDERQVRPNRARKSVGAEDTFRNDIYSREAAQAEIVPLIEKVWRYCEAYDICPRTVTVKIKYSDFKQITRSRSTTTPISSIATIKGICRAILTCEFPSDRGVRLLGITLSSLERAGPEAANQQFDLGL
jgi:DNA polymerase-4